MILAFECEACANAKDVEGIAAYGHIRLAAFTRALMYRSGCFCLVAQFGIGILVVLIRGRGPGWSPREQLVRANAMSASHQAYRHARLVGQPLDGDRQAIDVRGLQQSSPSRRQTRDG